MSASLLLQSGEVLTRISLANGGLTIGRLPENDLTLDSESIRPRHARIITSPEGYVLENLNPTGRTLVNDERIERHVLHHGDRVTLGGYSAVFASTQAHESDHAAARAPAAAATSQVPGTSDPPESVAATGPSRPPASPGTTPAAEAGHRPPGEHGAEPAAPAWPGAGAGGAAAEAGRAAFTPDGDESNAGPASTSGTGDATAAPATVRQDGERGRSEPGMPGVTADAPIPAAVRDGADHAGAEPASTAIGDRPAGPAMGRDGAEHGGIERGIPDVPSGADDAGAEPGSTVIGDRPAGPAMGREGAEHGGIERGIPDVPSDAPPPAAVRDDGDNVGPGDGGPGAAGDAPPPATVRDGGDQEGAGPGTATAASTPTPDGGITSPAWPQRERDFAGAAEAAPGPPLTYHGSGERAPLGYLHVVSGPLSGHVMTISKPRTTIGFKGRRIAVVEYDRGHFRVRRLDSTRTVMLNGDPLGATTIGLKPGDVLELADTRLRFSRERPQATPVS